MQMVAGWSGDYRRNAYSIRYLGICGDAILTHSERMANERRRVCQLDTRYSCNERDFKRYTTEEIRNEFLIESLFVENKTVSVYTHVDRMVIMGCMPVSKTVSIEESMDVWGSLGVNYFLERRELGIFNVAPGIGRIIVDGTEYTLGYKDCLYIAMGAKEVLFASNDIANPAKFYMVSAPAHRSYETRLLTKADAAKKRLGALETSNRRSINQFIHTSVLKTCQLCMGLTELEPGSVWNTMPAHTHERRMEVYYYFEVPENEVIFHFMGRGRETRHIVMQNEQAVISPSWSIHAGAGTSNYTFIWAMGGENQAFDDMDPLAQIDLR